MCSKGAARGLNHAETGFPIEAISNGGIMFIIKGLGYQTFPKNDHKHDISPTVMAHIHKVPRLCTSHI